MFRGEEAAQREPCKHDVFKDIERGKGLQKGLLREVGAWS